MRAMKNDKFLALFNNQNNWIKECGGDLNGYIANYHGKYNRSIESTTQIYNADMNELKRLKAKLKF